MLVVAGGLGKHLWTDATWTEWTQAELKLPLRKKRQAEQALVAEFAQTPRKGREAAAQENTVHIGESKSSSPEATPCCEDAGRLADHIR